MMIYITPILGFCDATICYAVSYEDRQLPAGMRCTCEHGRAGFACGYDG